MNWAVIMAGGNGTRFWPLSNSHHPKQFLNLLGDETPASSCLNRISRVVERDRILIVASEQHREALKSALPDFPESQILWEPVGRNTAPCIAWVTEIIRTKDSGARIGVFPSDHHIEDVDAFAESLKKAFDCAEGRIVLFGIVPTRPETGYGYIECGEPEGEQICRVASFREKPDAETAGTYLEAGTFLWNSGMFIFDAQVMHEEIERYVPQISRTAQEIVEFPDRIEALFPAFLSISIDYAVMEHTKRAVVLRASFPWDDLGTWESIRRYFPTDESGNASHGKARMCECRNTFVYSEDGRRIATLSLDNIVVVSTEDAVLVIDASRSQDVKKLIE